MHVLYPVMLMLVLFRVNNIRAHSDEIFVCVIVLATANISCSLSKSSNLGNDANIEELSDVFKNLSISEHDDTS
jgi:hypothetical protein